MKPRKTKRQLLIEERAKALMGDHIPEDLHDYRVDRHQFIIYVGGDTRAPSSEVGVDPGVEHNMADRFKINMNLLSGIDKDRPILIELASVGGEEDEGMEMFDAILNCPNPTTVLATRTASSMASIIPLPADRLVLNPSAKYMFHMGSIAFSGTPQEARTWLKQNEEFQERMMRLYVARLRSRGAYSDLPERSIRKMLDDRIKNEMDVYLSAHEAQRAGFVDDVFDGNFNTLRATKKNLERRRSVLSVLRRPVKVEIKVS